MEQLRWAKEELKTLDSMTRKVLTMNGAFHSKRDVNRLYVSREDEGRELISCVGCVRGEENSFGWYVRNFWDVVGARNVFRYLFSIFMFAAFLVNIVFAPLVLFFGSLVFHCPRSFVLRVRVFLHNVYLAFIVIFASVLR